MQPEVKILVLPGGMMPERKSDGAAGYDVFARAIVHTDEMDPQKPYLRKTLFDFQHLPADAETASHVFRWQDPERPDLPEELVYVLGPTQRVLIGIGFITEMEFPMLYWTAPRSGLASRYGITIANAPGTVDADYRGEAGITLLNNGNELFVIRRHMRIAQLLFQKVIVPDFTAVVSYAELSNTNRGAGGFGSTGLK